MWFMFPKGTTQISVQQQNFGIEHTDSEGNTYFRAPNHFAPIIQGLNGFKVVGQPDGAPDDLPLSNPMLDGQIANMAQEVETMKEELVTLRADRISSTNALRAAETERDQLRTIVATLEARIRELEEELEDEGKVAPQAAAPAGAKAK